MTNPEKIMEKVKEFRFKQLVGCFDGGSAWFRLFGVGAVLTNGTLLFSERYGYTKYLPVGFGWRIRFLKRRDA